MSTKSAFPHWAKSVTEATVATWFKKPGDAVASMKCSVSWKPTRSQSKCLPRAAALWAKSLRRRRQLSALMLCSRRIIEGSDRECTRQSRESRSAEQHPAASVDVMVPTLGEVVTEATVSTWFKKVGDTSRRTKCSVSLETDKVSVEVPAPAAGVLSKFSPRRHNS